MDTKFIEIVMNPVRQRMVQYLMIHGSGTVGEMARELSDIPRPSLYRHMKLMLEAGCVEIAEERAVRGTRERTYRLVAQPIKNPTKEDMAALIQGALTSIMASFARYLQREDADPQKDLVSLSTSTLMLSDQELMDFLGKLGQLYNEVITNGPREDRKPRSVTFIVAPTGEKEEQHA